MTLDQVIGQLTRGHCSEKQAAASGCSLCVPQYEALRQVEEWHRELTRLRAAQASGGGGRVMKVQTKAVP